MKLYLAGPDVFLPDAVAIGRAKVDLCASYGHTGLFPLDNQIVPAADMSMQLFRGNEAMMDRAEAIIANLTPFRGPSADAGTVYELGYMAGQGKLCLGYCNEPALYVDRLAKIARLQTHSDGTLTDESGFTVENFGQIDNLMVVHSLDVHGYPVVMTKIALPDIWHDMSSFEACLRLLAEHRTENRAQHRLL